MPMQIPSFNYEEICQPLNLSSLSIPLAHNLPTAMPLPLPFTPILSTAVPLPADSLLPTPTPVSLRPTLPQPPPALPAAILPLLSPSLTLSRSLPLRQSHSANASPSHSPSRTLVLPPSLFPSSFLDGLIPFSPYPSHCTGPSHFSHSPSPT